MHLVLTDRLACPRCGPAFGLILLAEELRERRVLEGRLGCPNCRERYPVVAGFGDLRPPPRDPLADEAAPEPTEGGERAGQLGTLLGAGQGPGHTLVVGRAVVWAPALAAGLAEGAEVVALSPRIRGWSEAPGVSRMTSGPTLPFFDRSVRGVLVHGADLAGDSGDERGGGDLAGGDGLLREAARVLAPGSRVVVLDPPPGIDARLAAAGLPEALASTTLAAAGR